MTASLRGLAVLAAIAAALLVLALIGGAPEVVDRALAPGLDVATVARLQWVRPGQRDVVAIRGPQGWRVDGAQADADAIDAVVTALRAGRWQRRADVAAAGNVTTTLIIGGASYGTSYGVAQPLADTDQAWLVVDDHALLVDAWVARALAPPPLALHARRPFADLGAGWVVELAIGDATSTVDLASRERTAATTTLRLAPSVSDGLVRALADLEVVALATSAITPPDGSLRIVAHDRTATRRVQLAGPCPGAPQLTAIAASTGDGCIDHAVGDDLYAATGAIDAPLGGSGLAALVDPRPAAGAVTVQLADGSLVDTRRAATVAGAPADPDAVAALLAALAAPCEIVASPTAPTRATLVATDRAGVATRLELHGDVVVRAGEPLGLRPTAAALAALAAPAAALRDRQLWVEEPTAIATLELDGETLHRGAVVGEWDTAPARFATIDLLAAAVAAPRALATADPAPADAASHRVAFSTAPPVGAPVHHELDVAVARDGRCLARTRTDTRVIERALCDAVAAAISSRAHPDR